MDSGEIYRVSSTRMNSSTIWRNSAMDVFSKSSRDEDDEEALKWASIERLPTYLRVRRGILSLEGESAREIDVQNLGLMERRNILERLVKIAEEDNERFLLKLKNRMERYCLFMKWVMFFFGVLLNWKVGFVELGLIFLPLKFDLSI